MTKNSSHLIRQAQYLPFIALLQIALGLIANDYNSMSQHISELGVRDNALGFGIRVLALLLGGSLFLFCVGLFQSAVNRFNLSLFMLAIFSLAMISNGLYKMGSPMHGLFGLGMIITLIPIGLACDFYQPRTANAIRITAAITSFLSFIYMWAGIVGLEPEAYAGLIQRVIMLINLCWFAYFARSLTFTR